MLSWEEAEEKCMAEKANLASIISAEENEFFYNLVGNVTVWIGASEKDKEGVGLTELLGVSLIGGLVNQIMTLTMKAVLKFTNLMMGCGMTKNVISFCL